MHYKTIFTICAFIFSSTLHAQTELPSELDSPRKRADKLTLEMTKKMKLKANQIQPIDSLNYAYAVIMQKEVIDQDLSFWSQYRISMQIMDRKDQQLKTILSEEQYKKYKDLKAEAMVQIIKKRL